MYVTVLCGHLALKLFKIRRWGRKKIKLDLGVEYVSQPVREATQGHGTKTDVGFALQKYTESMAVIVLRGKNEENKAHLWA